MKIASARRSMLVASGVALSLLLGACSSAPSGSTGGDGDTDELVVGVLLGLTGLAPETGEAARVSVSAAADDINAAGGIAGRQVKLVITDTESDPTTATLEVSRLLDNEGVEVVIGPMFSQESLAVLPVLGQRGIFSVHQTGSLDITPSVGPYAFGNLMDAGTVAEKMVTYMNEELSPQRVAVVHDPGAQALSGLAVVEDALAGSGTEIVAVVEHAYGVTDMTPILLQATRNNPDVILLLQSNGGDLGNFLQARKDLGRDDIPVVANNVAGAVQQVALDVAGGDETIFEGVTGVTATSFATCDESTGGSPVEFGKQITEYLGKEPSFALAHASLFYDALYIIKAAVEGTDGATDGPTLTEWMYNNISTFEGVYKNLTASPQSHFLVGTEGLAIINPLPILPGGMVLGVDCQ